MNSDIYGFVVKDAHGVDHALSDFKGKVLMIVNTASACGFTPQYEGLQKLYEKYRNDGFEILGFPCNQFGGQEPGDNDEIQQFCRVNYGVTFPVFAKIEVNGKDADPLFKYLKQAAPGILGTLGIKWNFTKFLVDRTGRVLRRFGPADKPSSIENEIRELVGDHASH